MFLEKGFTEAINQSENHKDRDTYMIWLSLSLNLAALTLDGSFQYVFIEFSARNSLQFGALW